MSVFQNQVTFMVSYQIYQDNWIPVIGEQLDCKQNSKEENVRN